MPLDITNIVNVSIVDVPAGLAEVNVNNLLLLTTDTPSNVDVYRTYLNAADVGTDYGTGSETYTLASAVFAQSPNILTGNGSLVVAPMVSAVSATAGNFVTANISTNLTALTAVSNGDIKILLNGNAINLVNLNFTACNTLADIAAILQRSLPNIVVSATTTQITFASKKVGSTSAVIVEAPTTGSGTDLSTSGLLNTAGGTATSGANSSGETIVDAINRLNGVAPFTPFFTNLQIEDAVAVTTATAIQGLVKYIWVHSWSDTNDLAGVITTINSALNTKTKTLLYTPDLSDAITFRAAYSGKTFSVNFDGVNTFSTTQLKTLNGIAVDNGITQSVYNTCHAVGADTYDNFGIPAITVTKYGTTGLFIDQVYGQLWLTFALQVNVFNAFATTVVGIRQTQTGLNQLISAINNTMSQGVTVGYIGVGLAWNSSSTFGNLNNFLSAIFTTGYYIYANSIVTQPQVDRAARQAPLIQIAYKEAGFINTATILGLVEA